MSDNPGSSQNMYISTSPKHRVQYIRSSDEQGEDDEDYDYHDHEATAPEHNQTFYSIPRASLMDELQSLPVDSYTSSIKESDTETNYKTPNTSIYKSNHCRPAYFDKTQSNQSTLNNTSNYSETDYIDIPANFREFCKPSCSSSAKYTTESSTICSKNKKFIMENPDDLQLFRRRHLDVYPESEDESEDIAVNLMLNVNKEPQYRKNTNWNPNVDEQMKKYFKPQMSMETYPCSSQPQKKNRWTPPNSNVSFLKQHEYSHQHIPAFLSSSDSTAPSTIRSSSSASNEKSLDPIYMKYASKEDLSAKSDSINMLSVVISTVMLLASKSQIPQNYVTWTLKYLKCIKNKQGQYPPNIQKIQQMLTGHGQQKDQEKEPGKDEWHCKDFLAGGNPGKRMDLTKTRKKCNK